MVSVVKNVLSFPSARAKPTNRDDQGGINSSVMHCRLVCLQEKEKTWQQWSISCWREENRTPRRGPDRQTLTRAEQKLHSCTETTRLARFPDNLHTGSYAIETCALNQTNKMSSFCYGFNSFLHNHKPPSNWDIIIRFIFY